MGMGSDQQFCLRWHNYQSNLLATLPQFLDSDNLTDVTLSAGGRSIRAHKVVLSACSQYFNELFKVLHPIQHPVVVIPGTTFSDLCALVTFMYSGEVNIYQEQLQGLLSMADAMQIRGLAEVSGGGKNTVPRKENCGQMKRSRLCMQTPGGTDIMNAETSSDQCGLQPLQAEPVANHSQYQKGKNDSKCGFPSRRSVTAQHSKDDASIQHSSTIKQDLGNSKAVSDTLEHFSELQTPEYTSNSTSLNDKDGTSYSKDKTSSAVPSLTSVQESMSQIKVETEMDTSDTNNTHEMLDVFVESDYKSSTRVSHSSNTNEKHQSYSNEMDLILGQQSPPSDDSGGSICNTDRMQHSSNTALTSLKLKASSGQFSKFYLPNPTTSNTSKLYATCFVCGKQLSNQYNLRVHLETHQNVNYACSVCSHISRSRDALRKHVSYRHPGEAREKVGFGGLIKDARISGGNTSNTSKKSKINDSTEDDKPVST